MPTVSSGVFPCYVNQFKIGAAGSGGNTNTIKDMEEYSVSFDNGVEEWTAYDEEGWVKRLLTKKGIKISVKGKRNFGDAGNDDVASCAKQNGRDAERDLLWTLPDGSTILFSNAIINVTALGAAGATNVAPLEWEALSNGKPTFTPAA